MSEIMGGIRESPARAFALDAFLQDALSEVARYSGGNRLYWWREASMQKLQQMGLVEQWLPASVAKRKRMKSRPWRITEAGKQALADATNKPPTTEGTAA